MFVNGDVEGEKGDVEIGRKPRRVQQLQSCQHATQEKTSDEHKASNFYLLNKSTTRKIK